MAGIFRYEPGHVGRDLGSVADTGSPTAATGSRGTAGLSTKARGETHGLRDGRLAINGILWLSVVLYTFPAFASPLPRSTSPMKIASVRLRGFRNFKDAFINLADKSLIIGYNDVGKTNFIYALRLLLDRTLAESALEPIDSDFYVYERTDVLSIELHLTDVSEDCLLSQFREYIRDEEDLFLVYEAERDLATGKKSYTVKAGPIDALEKLPSRTYLKHLNLRVVEGKRDLSRFIRKERRALLEDAKKSRTDDQKDSDSQVLREIEAHLQEVNAAITKLNYVGSATDTLNNELSKLSYRYENQRLVFGTTTANPSGFVEDLELVSRVDERTIGAGGDGRHNQIQLALWTARNQIARGSATDPDEVSVYCIEEPEAHLHPHQQRKLASYLSQSLTSQVILTSHSPQIAAEFAPSSLIRLYDHERSTVAAAAGCSDLIRAEVINFGYRMSILPAEAFFASAVLLVEGPSELLFYRAVARALGIDLDRLNISVISVDGIGFDVYCRLLSALSIPFAIRTDNDVFRVPKSDGFRFAGILRGVEIAKNYRRTFNADMVENLDLLTGFQDPNQLPEQIQTAAAAARATLAQHGIFIADKDLEHDLYAAHSAAVLEYTGEESAQGAIECMRSAKANFMFEFLQTYTSSLSALAHSNLIAPLAYCQRLIWG